MNIGNTIRLRRQAKEMTQENLAELLRVSVSAVSLWECGKTMPDITLIPPLCSVLEISADELLEINLEKKEADVDAITEEAHRFGDRGFGEEALEILDAGLKKYPDHPKLLGAAMHFHYMISCRNSASEHRDKAQELGERILEKCTDIHERSSAIQTLCFLYRDTNPQRISELMEQTVNQYVSRSYLAVHAYKGDKQIDALHDLITSCADTLAKDLPMNPKADSGERRYTREEQMTVYEKIIAIFHILFEDGDFGFYHTRLQDARRALAEYHADKKDAENALIHLEKQAYHAVEFVKFAALGDEQFVNTSLAVRGCKTGGFSTNNPENNAREVLSRMEHARWDFVRETEKFSEIRDYLAGYAAEWTKKA